MSVQAAIPLLSLAAMFLLISPVAIHHKLWGLMWTLLGLSLGFACWGFGYLDLMDDQLLSTVEILALILIILGMLMEFFTRKDR